MQVVYIVKLIFAYFSICSALAAERIISDVPEGCPTIIKRAEWNAQEPKKVVKLETDPPPYVVVHHSATILCTTKEKCSDRVRSIQSYHMSLGWADIGYQFLIGGDGNIYEGRGWGVHGAHVVKFNSRSIGICLIGNFDDYPPLEIQIQSLRRLIACGNSTNRIAKDYKVIGHRQGSATLCPGNNLYNLITTWPEFERNPK